MNATNNKSWLALIGICLASFLGCIDFTIVNTALPTIQNELNASVTQLQWIINIFMLTLAATMVVMGRVADIYGRRLLLYIGMVVFALSSLGAGLSPSIHSLVFFRFLQGMSVAILYTVPIAMIPSLFPENMRGKATGILIGVNGLGLAIGPVVGGLILSALSWRWVFFVNPPIVIVSLLFCWKNVIESKSHEHGKKIDWYGLVLLMLCLPLLILAIVEGNAWGWTSPITISVFAIAIIGLIAFYIIEHRVQSPIIQFNLFKSRIFSAGLTANFALAFFYTVAFFLMPLYLHNIQNQSGLMIGLTLLPASMMVALLSPLVGAWVDKSGPKMVLCVGFLLFMISALMQAHFSNQTSLIYIVFTFVLFGIGWACILSPSIIAAISSVPESASGVAMGSLGTLHNFGGAIGLAIGTVVYHYHAKVNLIVAVNKLHVITGAWVEQAIADPDHATTIIKHAAHVSATQANQLFHQFFLSGYSAAMLLLAVISFCAFIIVLFGLKSKTS